MPRTDASGSPGPPPMVGPSSPAVGPPMARQPIPIGLSRIGERPSRRGSSSSQICIAISVSFIRAFDDPAPAPSILVLGSAGLRQLPAALLALTAVARLDPAAGEEVAEAVGVVEAALRPDL